MVRTGGPQFCWRGLPGSLRQRKTAAEMRSIAPISKRKPAMQKPFLWELTHNKMAPVIRTAVDKMAIRRRHPETGKMGSLSLLMHSGAIDLCLSWILAPPAQRNLRLEQRHSFINQTCYSSWKAYSNINYQKCNCYIHVSSCRPRIWELSVITYIPWMCRGIKEFMSV